jgi:hypothetical protein
MEFTDYVTTGQLIIPLSGSSQLWHHMFGLFPLYSRYSRRRLMFRSYTQLRNGLCLFLHDS